VDGRKRGIASDVLGLVMAVVVTAAGVHDNAIGITLLDKVAAANPSVTKAWTDAGFKNAVAAHGAGLGIDVEVVRCAPHTLGFAPLPKRWMAEQVYGTLVLAWPYSLAISSIVRCPANRSRSPRQCMAARQGTASWMSLRTPSTGR
jgi:hypothetical protein